MKEEKIGELLCDFELAQRWLPKAGGRAQGHFWKGYGNGREHRYGRRSGACGESGGKDGADLSTRRCRSLSIRLRQALVRRS